MSYDFNDHADWATQEREMSEIKCPCCGSDLDYYVSAVEGDDDPIWYECMSRSCMFSCNGADLTRITAAMELAKSVTGLQCERSPEFYNAVSESKRRVLEVFGK